MSDARLQSGTSPTPKRWLTGGVYFLIAALVTLLALLGWAFRGSVPTLQNLEGLVMDTQQRLRGPLAPGTSPEIAILLIDERSLEALGSLPVDRRILATTLDKLRESGARWVALDMLFVEPARGGPEADQALAAAIRKSDNVLLPFALLATGKTPVLAQSTTALPAFIENNAYMRYRNPAARERLALQPRQLLLPIPLLGQAAKALGHVTAKTGADGAVRYDQPAVWLDEEVYPSLALRLAALVRGQPWSGVEVQLGQQVQFDGPPAPLKVPLDMLGRQWVNYYGPGGTFPLYSLHDFLQGKLPPETFRDKIVLVGGSILGNSDRYPSPFDPVLLGVERLATVLDNLLTQRWLARPAWAAPLEIALMLLLPLLAVMLIRRWRPALALGLLIVLAGGLLAGTQLLFVQAAYFLSVLFPLFALLLSAGLALAWRARLDERFRREAERQLAISEERYALAAQGANDGLWDWHIESDRAFFSQRWQSLMQVEDMPSLPERGQVFPFAHWLACLPELECKRFQCELDSHLQGESRQFHHVFMLGQGKQQRWLLARGVAIREEGRAVRMAGSLTDITAQKQLEQQISFDALHDRQTGLANRTLFLVQLQQLLAQEAGVSGVAVILIDIDHFRSINEKYGDAVGNTLLSAVATRLQGLLPAGMVLARLGSDLFALAQREAATPAALPLVTQVHQQFAVPFLLAGDQVRVSATVAVAQSVAGMRGADELLNAAHLALLNGKQHFAGQVHYFDPAEQAQENQRVWLQENLERAIAAGDQFQLYYQPLVRLSDRRLTGFEALIRWQHPTAGFIQPGEFIPFAEESGQIIEIGRWTLHQACRQLKAWEAVGFTGEIAVNLSGRQFSEADLAAEAAGMLRILAPLPARRIKLEVTESMSMAQPERTVEILQGLSAMGFRLAIDDFGTGYSSLAYLHRFPFDLLKIDRSFVIRLGVGREAQEVIRTIVGLAEALGKQTLAEGVEDEDQASQLAALGVQIGQGWLFGKPLPVEEATACIVADLQAVQPE